MNIDLTKGSITKNLILFALPFILGDLLQQLYNITDTLIVGRTLGENALAAVGSAYTLMVFLTSILLGLCMGSSAYFSILYGKKEMDRLKNSLFLSFVMIALLTLAMTIVLYLGIDSMIHFLQVPDELTVMMKDYLLVIFGGIAATFLYNYFASVLRSLGNSLIPLMFLAVSALFNIALDLLFILCFEMGVKGAALATIIAQYVSGFGIMVYYMIKFKKFHPARKHCVFSMAAMKEIFSLSFLTCIQQSIMNLGILLVQGLVNSFGTAVMAAFAAGVKIDSFAYMPLQDYGNAFSTFIAQNHGAKQPERIHKGIKSSLIFVFIFSVMISALVFIFARPLISIFIDSSNIQMIKIGTDYLRIEGFFYFGIGLLFMLYGYYRAIQKPAMSVILTIISLGTRVLLAYQLSATILSIHGIWLSVPIGWALADIVGCLYYLKLKKPLQ